MQGSLETVGDILQRIRQGREVELSALSRLSGVHRATLHRWERGETLPRLPELEAVLNALKVTDIQKQQVFAEMNTRRARSVLRNNEMKMSEQLEIGTMPHGGDLLQAMRLRRGLSRERMATHLHVSTRTIRLWEKAEVWPSMGKLHQICYLLRAQEPEIAALTCGRVNLHPAKRKPLSKRFVIIWMPCIGVR